MKITKFNLSIVVLLVMLSSIYAVNSEGALVPERSETKNRDWPIKNE
jgi:hypothetical protein